MKTIRETPDNVITLLAKHAEIKDGLSLLEPSAGEGKIIDYFNHQYKLKIDAVELNKEKYLVLKEKNYSAYHKDFLNFNPEIKYDRIVACPPFKGNLDLLHIQHMFNLLNEKGILVSLTSPYWITNNEAHQKEFRTWLSDKNHLLEMIPDESFKENHLTVPTAIIKIWK